MEQEKQTYFEKVEQYFDQLLAEQEQYHANTSVFDVYKKTVCEAKMAVVRESKDRLQNIINYQEGYKKYPQVIEEMVRAENRGFNLMMGTHEIVSNTELEKCVNLGLMVRKFNFSDFFVDEVDGL